MKLFLTIFYTALIGAVFYTLNFDASWADNAASAAKPVLGQPHDKGLMFQEPATPVFERIIDFHEFVLYIISATTVLVLGVLMYICIRFSAKRNPNPSKTTHNTILEIVWTVVPVMVVVAILVPSIKLMYYMDKAENPDMTLKVVGYQWNWGYEYPDYGVENFISTPVREEDLKPGDLRLLTVDEPAYVPVGKTVQVLVTSADVIHSFAMPAFGVKQDAIPGRTNETWFRVDKEGTYYGQCSELCGKDHYFMPIVIKAVPQAEFDAWVSSKGGDVNLAAKKAAEAKALEAPAKVEPAKSNKPSASNTQAVEPTNTEVKTTINIPTTGLSATANAANGVKAITSQASSVIEQGQNAKVDAITNTATDTITDAVNDAAKDAATEIQNSTNLNTQN